MKINNSGMTLVEMILGTVLLAIASMMLLSSFTTAANIINRATLYKEASTVGQTMIELQSETYALSKNDNDNIVMSLERNDDLNSESNIEIVNKASVNVTNARITVQYTKSKNPGDNKTFKMSGDILKAKDSGESELTYREFLPGNYYFD